MYSLSLKEELLNYRLPKDNWSCTDKACCMGPDLMRYLQSNYLTKENEETQDCQSAIGLLSEGRADGTQDDAVPQQTPGETEDHQSKTSYMMIKPQSQPN